jgi:TatD DNase family protein
MPAPRLFDSHCHFDFSVFAEKRVAIWAECQRQSIDRLLIPGIYPEQWSQIDSIAQQLSGISMAVGVHPWWIGEMQSLQLTPQQLDVMHRYLQLPRCVAIGECGLDKLIDTSIEQQTVVFEQQLQLSCDVYKPLIIHVRKTHNEMLQLLLRYRPKAGGVIHGFSGSIELAQRYWQLGFYLGVGGAMTYPRATKTRAAIKAMPIEALVLETDAPDMPLAGFQGQANSPLRLPLVAAALAVLRNDSMDNIAYATTNNACRLFQL